MVKVNPVDSVIMVELENLVLDPVATSGDIVDGAGPGIDVLPEEVTSLWSVSEEVTVVSPERTGIVSVLKLVCRRVTVSSDVLRDGVDLDISSIDLEELGTDVGTGL